MRSTISASETTISGVQRRPSSSGMNSIKRTTTSSSRAKRANPSISVVIEAAQQDAVDLERGKAGRARGANACQYFFEAAGHAGDAFEGRRVDGVHADGYAIESGVLQRRGQCIEEMSVGGERQVERARRMECADCASSWISSIRPRRSKRLAAGKAHLFDPEAYEELDQAEVFGDRQFGVLGSEFAGAAVDALVVASVGDGDAQVVDDAAVAIGQPRGRTSPRQTQLGKWQPSAPFQAIPFRRALQR